MQKKRQFSMRWMVVFAGVALIGAVIGLMLVDIPHETQRIEKVIDHERLSKS